MIETTTVERLSEDSFFKMVGGRCAAESQRLEEVTEKVFFGISRQSQRFLSGSVGEEGSSIIPKRKMETTKGTKPKWENGTANER